MATLIGTSRNAWSVVIAYALAASAAMSLQLVFAPVTTSAAAHYGTSLAAIGWLSEVFPLMYVLIAIPAGFLLDRHFRAGLLLGAILIAGGAVLRLVGDSYAWAFAGQLICAAGQPLILNGVTKVAGDYLDERQRPRGLAVAMASIYLGQLVAILMGSLLAEASQTTMLLQASTLYAVAAAALLAVSLRRPGAFRSPEEAPPGMDSLRSLWSDGFIRTITVLAFIGIGAFTALLTWLQAILEPAGVSAAATGAMLIGLIVAGVVGVSFLPAMAMRRKREFQLLLLSGGVGVAAMLMLVVAPGMLVGLIVMPIDGLFLLAAMPVILELTERRAGARVGTATALVWMAGNAGSLLIAMGVQALINRPTLALMFMIVVSAVMIPLTFRLRRQFFAAPSPGVIR
jgi:predicted MFS family arabinose efflux permease